MLSEEYPCIFIHEGVKGRVKRIGCRLKSNKLWTGMKFQLLLPTPRQSMMALSEIRGSLRVLALCFGNTHQQWDRACNPYPIQERGVEGCHIAVFAYQFSPMVRDWESMRTLHTRPSVLLVSQGTSYCLIPLFKKVRIGNQRSQMFAHFQNVRGRSLRQIF